LAKFLTEYLSDRALGQEGYLVDVGLVPLKDEQRSVAQSELVKLLKK
jgi:phosphate transport system substrate-binding protein